MSTRASGRASRPLLKRDPRQYDQSGPYRFSSRCRRTPTPATETKIPTEISTVSAPPACPYAATLGVAWQWGVDRGSLFLSP